MNQPRNKLHQQQAQKLFSRSSSTQLIQTLNVERLEKYVLAVQNPLLKKEIELYEWRQKTDFPIVKVESYKILDQKLEKTHIEVIVNSCLQKITDINELKIEDVTLLIKEAFIGLERLINKFKLFELSPEMVVIDQKNKCRVWVNSNFSLNQVERQVKDFQTFYRNVISIFEQVTLKNPNSMSFYLSLKTCNCFIKGLKFIEDFIKTKKLKPNPKPQIIKKVESTPNLHMHRLQKKLHSIEQQPKNFRQTIGYLTKKDMTDYKQANHQAMTFAGKNIRPLQKRLQQMIQQLPKDEIAEKNNLVLDKFRLKPQEQGGDNLKKVFRSIKDFKFRNTKNHHQKESELSEQANFQMPRTREKNMLSEKLKSQTTRHDCELSERKNYGFLQKSIQQTSKHIEEGTRFSVTETRSTSFFNSSNDRFCQQENSTHFSKKFGNIKFSEISHKKNSEISDFNKEIETILFGIEGNDKEKEFKKDIFSDENISSKSLHHPYERSNHNISILDNDNPPNESFKKPPPTKLSQTDYPTSSNNKSQPTDVSTSAKYGEIDQEIEQPTAEEISKKYIELGWKNTLNILSFGNEVSEMKESIHAGDDQRLGLGSLLGVEKKPIQLGKLDRIKNKQLVQSVMNEEFYYQ